ncbi:hypothetical protein ACIGD1_19550 [Streptomyces sp. NPDC085612]|uniref:hypothetical protein n=1 Tax=Streptomyces sp. NPDC085612 TaxID=3365732 RepID=UPI0037D2A087
MVALAVTVAMTWTPAMAQATIQAPAKAGVKASASKGSAAPAQRARQTPWPCNGQIMVVSGPNPVQLYTGATGAGTVNFSPVGSPQPLYHAIAIAPSTNIMYGSQGSTQNLIEINATTTPGCSIASGRLSCTSGALANGSSNTISLTGTAAASGVTSIANTAEVTGNDRDPNSANNRSTATTTVAPVTVPVITTPANGSIIRDCQSGRPNATERAENPGCTVPFAGTGVPGTRITVLEGRKVICTARVNANGATVRSEPVTVTIQSRHRPHHKSWPHHRPHDA